MVATVALGGTASNVHIATIGHGLMMMTFVTNRHIFIRYLLTFSPRWTPTPVPDEQAFDSIRQGVDAAKGAKVLLNSGASPGVDRSISWY